jgi:hypothetical protein
MVNLSVKNDYSATLDAVSVDNNDIVISIVDGNFDPINSGNTNFQVDISLPGSSLVFLTSELGLSPGDIADPSKVVKVVPAGLVVPSPPSSGTFTLQSDNGNLEWI